MLDHRMKRQLLERWVLFCWWFRRPGLARSMDRFPTARRRRRGVTPTIGMPCPCGAHPTDWICVAESFFDAWAPGVFKVISQPFFRADSTATGGVPWGPGYSQEWLAARSVELPRVILGSTYGSGFSGPNIGLTEDQWRASRDTAVLSSEPGKPFAPGQQFRRNAPGRIKGTLATDGRVSFYQFAYDWDRANYCRDQLLALGFSAADLTP